MKIGIIGAGLAGLACADALHASGHEILLFDKARGPGGRMATRRIATPLGDAAFDHGAQYFTVRDPAFQTIVDDWAARGIAGSWPPAGPQAWIGIPAMNAVAKHMAERHTARYSTHIQGLIRTGAAWRMMGEPAPIDTFDAIVIAVPAEQAAALVAPHDLAMARHALLARSQPCWTAMFAFDRPIDTDRIVIRDRGVIGWAAHNSAKTGRRGPEAWVVQANGAWSADNIDAQPDTVEAVLLGALAKGLGARIRTPIASAAHRWRYALSAGNGEGALWNPALRLGLCGDWLLGPRVECAWLSGQALSRRIDACALVADPVSGS